MRYLLLGLGFGVVLSKAQIISWFRIQEMFRFQSFHMYGVIGSAVAVAALSLLFLRARGLAHALRSKEMGRGTRYWLGGAIFGLGWGITGACPGPIFALLGNGYLRAAALLLLSAVAGTLAYALLRPRLPH